jgi:hypothetical protein
MSMFIFLQYYMYSKGSNTAYVSDIGIGSPSENG